MLSKPRNRCRSSHQLPNFKAFPSKGDYLPGPTSVQKDNEKKDSDPGIFGKTKKTDNDIFTASGITSSKMPRVLSAPPYLRSATKRSSKRKKNLPPKKSLKKTKTTEPPHSGQLQPNKEEICATLGLRENFLQRLESFPEDIRYHKSVKGWLLTFIENEYNDIEPQSSFKTKLSEELLKELGFINPEVMDTIMTRSKQMENHLNPIEFVKRYIEDEFKNNTALPDSVRKEASALCGIDVNILSFSEYRNDERNEHCELRILFHGTDLSSAENIMKNGIDVYFGKPKHDFSDGSGFYLTDDFEHAKTWAYSISRKPAVLEFKIPITCLSEARRLDLDISNEEKKSLWYQIVTEYRSGVPSRKLRQKLENYDFITGPISVPSDERSGVTTRKPKPNSYQICVVSEDMAEKIGKHAKYTLYIE